MTPFETYPGERQAACAAGAAEGPMSWMPKNASVAKHDWMHPTTMLHTRGSVRILVSDHGQQSLCPKLHDPSRLWAVSCPKSIYPLHFGARILQQVPIIAESHAVWGAGRMSEGVILPIF